MSTRTERVFAALQGPVLGLDTPVIHMFKSYTAELLLPRRLRQTLGLSISDVFAALQAAVVRADPSPSSPPVRCPRCGDVLTIAETWSNPSGLPEDLESFCASVRSKCTSSRRHLRTTTLFLTVDIGRVLVCSRAFSVFAREPGRCKKNSRGCTPAQEPSSTLYPPDPPLVVDFIPAPLRVTVDIFKPRVPVPLPRNAIALVNGVIEVLRTLPGFVLQKSSLSEERIFAALQGPVLGLDTPVIHMFKAYTAELLLPRRLRQTLGLSISDVFAALQAAVVRADPSPSSPPVRCPRCGDVLAITETWSNPSGLPEDLESFCTAVRSRCTSSRRHLRTTRLVLTVDIGRVLVCSKAFSVFARDPGPLRVTVDIFKPRVPVPLPPNAIALVNGVIEVLRTLPGFVLQKSSLSKDLAVLMSTRTERVFAALQGPVLGLDTPVIHMFKAYTAELLLPRRLRQTLGLSISDVFAALQAAVVRADPSPSSPPVRCPRCGDVLAITETWSNPSGLPDDLESFCASVRSKCTSSRRHLRTTRLVLTVDIGRVLVCSSAFSVFAREPGRYKKRQGSTAAAQETASATSTPPGFEVVVHTSPQVDASSLQPQFLLVNPLVNVDLPLISPLRVTVDVWKPRLPIELPQDAIKLVPGVTVALRTLPGFVLQKSCLSCERAIFVQNAKWVNVSNCELRLNLPRKNVLLPLSPAMELKDAFFSLVSPEVVTYIASVLEGSRRGQRAANSRGPVPVVSTGMVEALIRLTVHAIAYGTR
eukprot:m51a1_g13934 hypothetical protein (761) ;mRNA; f:864067-869694